MRFRNWLSSLGHVEATPRLLAQNALVLSTTMEPLVQARRVESIMTCPAFQIWHRVRLDTHNGVAHRTWFNALKFLINVFFP